MADDLKFSEEGLKLQESLAKMLDEGLEAYAAGTALGLSMGGVIGAAAFVLTLIKFMTSDDENKMIEALKSLQRQIDEIRGVLEMLDGRIDELVDQSAVESNRATMRDLLDYFDQIEDAQDRLTTRPNDVDVAVEVANAAANVCDKFLRSDYDIWRWTDIVEKLYVNPATGQGTMQNALALGRFKNMPTLPVYAAGLLTWLAAREKAVQGGKKHLLSDDQKRLDEHRFAMSVRPEFDKYHPDEARSTPQTIPEHIRWRIRAYPTASTRHAVNRICQFYFDVGNMMTGKRQTGAPFDLLMPPGTVLCTLDPNSLGAPDMEIDMETAAGVDALYELSELLGRLANGGSLRTQFIGVFPNIEVFPPAILYVIDQNADLQWYRNESAAARGGSKDWAGPKKVGNGWGGFTTVFNGGGHAIYGIKSDGVLLWYGHDGGLDGGQNWRSPIQVGTGWQGFKSVFSGGEYVVYGIKPDGQLLWYRHDGAPSGGTSWAGPNEVGTGWQGFQSVFSGGDGIIYSIRPDGVLESRKHKGYLTGTTDWEPKEEIGTGWADFREVVAAADGVIYAFTRDGRILWYRYGKRPPLPPQESPNPFEGMVTERPSWTRTGSGVATGLEGMVVERPRWTPTGGTRPEAIPHYVPNIETGPIFSADVKRWEGPIEIKRGFPAFRSVFVRMSMPYRGPS